MSAWEHMDFNGEHFRLRKQGDAWALFWRRIGPSGISWSSLSEWRTRSEAKEAAAMFVPGVSVLKQGEQP